MITQKFATNVYHQIDGLISRLRSFQDAIDDDLLTEDKLQELGGNIDQAWSLFCRRSEEKQIKRRGPYDRRVEEKVVNE